MTRVLIVGGNGQLGRCLTASAPVGVEVVSRDVDILNVTDAPAIDAAIDELRPELVLNAAAYTAVDKAESDEAAACAVNGDAVGYLAEAARKIGARFVHVSTDFVFDGRANSPYLPSATPHPLSAYGRTKLIGEQRAGANALIVRTAWVYAPTGGNFVRTMLRLMASHPQVKVVCDQVGTPTYGPALAETIWTLSNKGYTGLFHYTDAGIASWYDFAVAIQEEALAAGLLTATVSVIPVATAEYPTPAIRPAYSVLDKTATWTAIGKVAPHWRVNLRKMLREIKLNG